MTAVLLVDDDANLLASLRRQIHRMRPDWVVQTAESGNDALHAIGETSFDVVVTDMSMPGMSGLELVRAINQQAMGPKCMVLTGTADLETAAEVINTARVSKFFTKPCPVERLVAGIGDALRQQGEGAVVTGSSSASERGWRALDRLAIAIILVDRSARVLHMNQLAAEIIAQRDGLSLDAGGICRTGNPTETRGLHDLVNKAWAGTPNGEALACVISRPSQRQPLSLVVVSIIKGGEAMVPEEGVLLFINDPERPPDLNPALIAKLFGLTNSESRLACALASGRSIEEAASEMCFSVETARTYLKRVFLKTETRRQAELVKVILSVPNVLNTFDGFDASG